MVDICNTRGADVGLEKDHRFRWRISSLASHRALTPQVQNWLLTWSNCRWMGIASPSKVTSSFMRMKPRPKGMLQDLLDCENVEANQQMKRAESSFGHCEWWRTECARARTRWEICIRYEVRDKRADDGSRQLLQMIMIFEPNAPPQKNLQVVAKFWTARSRTSTLGCLILWEKASFCSQFYCADQINSASKVFTWGTISEANEFLISTSEIDLNTYLWIKNSSRVCLVL